MTTHYARLKSNTSLRSLLAVVSAFCLSATMACSTTDAEEAEDLALSADENRTEEMAVSEGQTAQAESDFSGEIGDQPLTAETAAADGEIDPFAPPAESVASEEALADPSSSTSPESADQSAENPEGSSESEALADNVNMAPTEEDKVLDASQEVASDLPEEPAVIEEFSDLTGNAPPAQDQAIVDPFAASEQTNGGEPTADPFASFANAEEGEASTGPGEVAEAAAQSTDPFANFENASAGESTEAALNAAPTPGAPEAVDGQPAAGENPFDANAKAEPVDSYFESASATETAASPAAIPADPFSGVDASEQADPYQAAPAAGREQSAPVFKQASARADNAASGSRAEDLGQTSNFSYMVAPGDTLSEIAQRIYGNVSEWRTIAQGNGISEPHKIYPGDVLQIQTFGSASAFAQAYQSVPEQLITVQAGETLFSIAERLMGNGSSWKYIWKLNEAEVPNPNVLRPGQVIRFRDFRDAQASL